MEPVHPIAPFEPLFKMTQLRMQNVWRIKVKGNREDERTHALSLYVHIRNNDLDYFNTNSSVYTQKLMELLIEQEAFQELIDDLDNMPHTIDKLRNKSLKSQQPCTVKNAELQMTWKIQERNDLSLTILERSNRERKDCFNESMEEYIGGMYKSMPLRKIALTIWMYPPDVNLDDHLPPPPPPQAEFFKEVHRSP